VSQVDILGVQLTAQPFNVAIDRLLAAVAERGHLRAHFCTVHSLVESTKDRSLAAAFASAQMVCTDGMPLVWVARRRGATTAERVAGPDVMLALCDRGRAAGLRHYLVGGGPGTAEILAERLGARFPGLDIAGTSAPPFRPLTRAEDDDLVDRINSSGASVVWIGLGAPKQELWAADHEARLHAPLVLPVGAAFDFHSGRLRRAPAWLRRFGLEWLFRVAMEPRRLARRYIKTNAQFLYLIAREEFARRRIGRSGRTSGS
jgi:N-acetylglucosaminyldiphosphoundecaprenol N-acetyl-beta-D-mannosaminyltransferase